MVLQRLANLPLLYHWRFFFPMVYVELFRFTRSIAGGFLFMNSFPGGPFGNPGKISSASLVVGDALGLEGGGPL